MSTKIEAIKAELLGELQSKGYFPGDIVFDSEKVPRFGPEKVQWYIAHLFTTKSSDPMATIYYGDWRGEKFQFQTRKVNLSPEDRAYLMEQSQIAAVKEREARKRYQNEIALEYQAKFETLSTNGKSPYLEDKEIAEPFGVRFQDDTIYVPCRNISGEIRTLQKIQPNGDKFFLPGGEVKGNFHVIGDLDSAETFYLAEGFATGASIHMAINKCVVIAFNADNLICVAQALHEKYQYKKVVVCGDDDQWTKKPDGITPTNPGRDKAKKAAKQVAGITVFPKFINEEPGQFETNPTKRPTDFDDLRYLEGLETVAEQIAKAEAAPKEEKERPPSQATLLVELCKSIELFHTSDDEGFATVPVNGHLETWALKSQGFKRWLTREYYTHHGSAPCAQSTQDALTTLGAKAQFEGEERTVFLRIASHNETVYIDMGNEEWEAIEINANAWKVIKNPPVKFIRSKRMLSLPRPIGVSSDEGVEQFRRFLNVETDEDFKLVVAWLINAFNPSGPYLVLVLYGEQGSAKSTMVNILRALIDPNEAPLRREPRTSDDLMVSAKGNWIVAIDNMSYLPPWLSDDLCRLATGGGLSKRELYTNDEETVLNAKRPIILDGIDEFVARGDLASRTITLHLPIISEDLRQREKTFFKDFVEVCPKILGALCNGISAAIENQNTFEMKQQLRMADAWYWISAAETAFGWPRGSSINAFRQNQIGANEIVLNSSIIYPFLRQLADIGWSGTCSVLLSKLGSMCSGGIECDRSWPKNAKTLSDKIRRLNPALRLAGIEIIFSKTDGNNSERIVTIRKVTNF